LFAYAKEKKIKLPQETEKFGYMSKDGPRTSYTYKCQIDFDGEPVDIELSYSREGLPSDKCKIVENIEKKIVCDLD
jgi:hypothetical protein